MSTAVLDTQALAVLAHDDLICPVTTDLENQQWVFSPQFCQMLGYTPEAWPYHMGNWQQMIAEDERELVGQYFTRMVNQGQPLWSMVFHCRHQQGYLLPLLALAIPERRNTQGRATGTRGIYLNLAGLAKKVQPIAHRNQQLELTVQAMNCGVWDCDLITGEQVWSPRYYQIIGYEPGEINPHHSAFVHLAHPEDVPRLIDAVQSHIDQGTVYQIEVRVRHKLGHYKWVQTSGTVARNADGVPVRMSGIMLDIDDRKQVSERLGRQTFLLSEAGKMARIGGWTYDLVTGIIQWTDACYDIHGVPRDFQLNYENVLAIHSPETRARLDQAVADAIRYGTTYSLESLHYLQTTATHRWIRFVGKPIYNEQGQVLKLAGAVQDIHEQKERELQLRRSLALIEEQNARLQNFAHIVSHNLRSHASNLQLLARILKEVQTPAERAEITELVKNTTARLSETLTHLNEIVRIQTDVNQQRTQIDLASVIDQVVQVVRPQLALLHGKVTTDLAACPTISFVLAYLESIFLNLITNALKYHSPDRAPHIHIVAQVQEGRPVITVSDNGLGIDLKRHGKKLFGMYKTFHRHEEARGLGLFITKNQIEAMGGKISVESHIGHGTTFTIHL